MTAFTFNFYIFLIAIVVFSLFAVWASQKINSPKSFFHSRDIRANTICLTAANITLGTGLAYLLQGGQQNGLLMLLIPVMVWLGYYLLASWIKLTVRKEMLGGKNFIASINDQIIAETNAPSHFSFLVSISLIIVFILLLSFEIFASSKIIAALLFIKGGNIQSIFISIIIIFIALLYTLFGGIVAVFRTDKLQLASIIIFLPVLFYTAVLLPWREGQSVSTIDSILKTDITTIIGIATASIAAVTTQFYSLLNWGAISHVDENDQVPMLKRVGIFTGVILAFIVIIGIFHPVNEGGDYIADLMASYSRLGSQSGFIPYILLGITVFGMTSIIFSTVDSLVITIIMFYYDNIAGRDSKSEENNPHELRAVRRIVSICFIFIFTFLGYFNFAQPNIFYLLLTITGGVVVFGPMFATVGYLSSKGNSLKYFSATVVYTYFGMFVIGFIISIITLNIKPAFVSWIGFFAFVIAALYSTWIIKFVRHQKPELYV